MKTKSSRTQKSLGKLVQRGFAIHQQLSVLNEEFKSIKDALKTEAPKFAHEYLPLLEKDSEGKQWVLRSKACECRIVFPDPKTTVEFDPGESDFLTIRSLAGDRFKSLFRKVTVYRPTDIPVLIARGLLKPLGNPPPNGGRYFAAREIERLRLDTKWLDKASGLLVKHWKTKNDRKSSTITKASRPKRENDNT